MIKSLSDAKRLVADVYNSIIDSLARKDTEIRRRAIDLLKDLFEENNYRVTEKWSDHIRFEAKQTFPDDWSSTGKRHHRIDRMMQFDWLYYDVDGALGKKGWNITVYISRYEIYHTNEVIYSENQSYSIEWSVSRKKYIRIFENANESKFTPKR